MGAYYSRGYTCVLGDICLGVGYVSKVFRSYVVYVVGVKALLVCGSIFGKRDLLAIDHIMLALFWSYVPNMK